MSRGESAAAQGQELADGETLHLDDCTLPGDHDGPCDENGEFEAREGFYTAMEILDAR